MLVAGELSAGASGGHIAPAVSSVGRDCLEEAVRVVRAEDTMVVVVGELVRHCVGVGGLELNLAHGGTREEVTGTASTGARAPIVRVVAEGTRRGVRNHAHVHQIGAGVAQVTVHVLRQDGEGRRDTSRRDRETRAVDAGDRAADDRRPRGELEGPRRDGLRLHAECGARNNRLLRAGRRPRQGADEVIQHTANHGDGSGVLGTRCSPLVDERLLIHEEPDSVVTVSVERVHLSVGRLHVRGPAHTERAGNDSGAGGRVTTSPVEVHIEVRLGYGSPSQPVGAEVGSEQTVSGHVSALHCQRVAPGTSDNVAGLVLAVLIPRRIGLAIEAQEVPVLVDPGTMERKLIIATVPEHSAGNEAVIGGITLVVVRVARSQGEGPRDACRRQRDVTVA
eukprot:1131096-Rhodomonas_salina.5